MSDFWTNLTNSAYEPNASLHLIIMLLVAFLLGYLLRFFIGGSAKHKTELEEFRASNKRLRDELDSVKRKAQAAEDVPGLRAELDLVRRKNRELDKDLSLLKSNASADSSGELEALKRANDELNKELEDCRKRSSVSANSIVAATPIAVSTEKPENPDDLTKIEGIGKKIQEHLNNGGIWSFEQLADTAVSRIQEILDAAGPAYTMHDPGTWPSQSEMARDGQWEKLEKWQGELKGGRKRRKR